MKTVFTLLFCMPFLCFAKSPEKSEIPETKVPVKEGYETMDMNQFKDLNRPSKSGPSVKFQIGCTSKSGVQYKEGDTGYEACLSEASGDNATGPKQGATPVGIKFGE